jgi:hypothetical protein
MMATHTTLRNMTQKVESTGHKVLWTILFLAHTFDDLRDQNNKSTHGSATKPIGHALQTLD